METKNAVITAATITNADLSAWLTFASRVTRDEIEGARYYLKELLREMVKIGRVQKRPEAEIAAVEAGIETQVDALCNAALLGISVLSETTRRDPVGAYAAPSTEEVERTMKRKRHEPEHGE